MYIQGELFGAAVGGFTSLGANEVDKTPLASRPVLTDLCGRVICTRKEKTRLTSGLPLSLSLTAVRAQEVLSDRLHLGGGGGGGGG